MTAKHTPGPLTAEYEKVWCDCDPTFRNAVKDADGEIIALTKNEGDTFLYAAAPELLEALARIEKSTGVALVNFKAAQAGEIGFGVHVSDWIERALKQTRAAIRKATEGE